MLYVRSFKNNTEITGSKKIIHGHQPHYIGDIIKKVKNREDIIPLDNGCSCNKPHKIFDYKRLSNLLCLNLDTFELIIQANIENLSK